MGKKRFFDDRLKYLSFIQNTGEKKAISEKIYPYISRLSQNKSYLRILDAGTGDGTINANIIKSFHKVIINKSPDLTCFIKIFILITTRKGKCS